MFYFYHSKNSENRYRRSAMPVWSMLKSAETHLFNSSSQ